MSNTVEHPETGGNESVNQTRALAERICAIDTAALDDVLIRNVKRTIADGIAVAVAGSRERAPQILSEHVRSLACGPHSTAWCFGFKTAPQLAAYVNAASMHVLDFESMSSPPTHASSPTVPVALALAESLGASGRDVIAAVAKGIEMQARLLLAGGHVRASLSFHTPGIVGAMGSAVTASHLLGLDAKQLANALGTAASRCSGLRGNTGSMVKSTHCGIAAQSGMEAALLAKRDFTSNPDILGAANGYVAMFFASQFDYDALRDFGKPYRCVEPGMAIKFYPSKYPTHFVIAAALDVRPAIPDTQAIREVRLLPPDIIDCDRPSPHSGFEGKFSFQYVAAVALIEGRIGLDSFTDEIRFRPDVEALIAKVKVIRDPSPSRSRKTSDMYIDIEVELEDGTVHTRRCNAPPGTWGKPFDSAQHHAKLTDCLSVRLEAPQRDHVLGLLDRFETLDAAGVRDLVARLA